MEAMKSDNITNPVLPKPCIFLELGDWVCEKSEYIQGKTRLSPPMYVVGIWTDGVYLEIDSEQGDPFEADYKDIVPIPLTKELLVKLDCYGKKRLSNTPDVDGVISKWQTNDYWEIHKHRNMFVAKCHEHTTNVSVCYLQYVHELQHFLRRHGIDMDIKL